MRFWKLFVSLHIKSTNCGFFSTTFLMILETSDKVCGSFKAFSTNDSTRSGFSLTASKAKSTNPSFSESSDSG